MRIHIGDECLAFSGTRPSELTVTVAVQLSNCNLSQFVETMLWTI